MPKFSKCFRTCLVFGLAFAVVHSVASATARAVMLVDEPQNGPPLQGEEKQLAFIAANGVPNVFHVQNDLEVEGTAAPPTSAW